MDFGPTLLHLAGLKIPDQMDGTPFLGKELTLKRLNRRNSVFCYGDRFDELYAFNRTLRVGRFKYVRNFLPYHPGHFMPPTATSNWPFANGNTCMTQAS